MIKAPIKNTKTMVKKLNRSVLHRICLIAVSFSFILASFGGSAVHADQYTQQIQNLEQQNSQDQSTIDGLQTQASSYQAEISQLQSQISSLEAQIQANQTEQTTVQAEIVTSQNELTTDKATLADDIRVMYAEGQTSTLEMLATSQNLSSFVNKEEYHNVVQEKIQGTLQQIQALQAQLNAQNLQLTASIQSENTNNTDLNNQQNQLASLLSYTQTQQASYTSQLQANNSTISQLRQEEIAANQVGVSDTISGGPCGGGGSYTDTYPSSLCNAGQDTIVDPWHMLNRECVSYTAWMASQESSVANSLLQEHDFGNATDWPGNAEKYGAAYGVTVSSTPQVGDIAIRPAVPGLTVDGESDVGHAMYVEAVENSTTIVVSEYNEDFNGDYSVQTRSTDATYNGYTDNLVFIHFPS